MAKKVVNESDVKMEYAKGFIWIVLAYLYFHFIVMGWTW